MTEKLLSRMEFHVLTLAKTNMHCLVSWCSFLAVDAHHILNRNLWEDGGYYLSNGAPLCARHHLMAETTELSVQEIREYLEQKPGDYKLPEGFDYDKSYDTWGNEIIDAFSRIAGPLFENSGCQRALQKAGVLWQVQASDTGD